jgi:hypothetical protein
MLGDAAAAALMEGEVDLARRGPAVSRVLTTSPGNSSRC